MVWYRALLFRTIHGMSYNDSRVIFWCLFLICELLGTLMVWKRWRNNLTVVTNISIPYCIYTTVTFWKSIHILFFILIIVAVVLSAALAYLQLSRPYRIKNAQVIRRRFQKILLRTGIITTICLTIIPVYLGASLLFRSGFPSSKVKSSYQGEENKLANNIEIVSKLDKDLWPALSTADKMAVLQTVANVEARYLGLPHELNVQLGVLAEDDLASYSDPLHMVTINIDHIEYDPPETILNSLCHECYHALQYRACDAYDTLPEEYKDLLEFYNLKLYKEEFAHYISDVSEEYFDQYVERFARAYGESSVKDYYSQINEYLGKTIADDIPSE